jgi:hypothetical protein
MLAAAAAASCADEEPPLASLVAIELGCLDGSLEGREALGSGGRCHFYRQAHH